jgi:hypothetical protein
VGLVFPRHDKLFPLGQTRSETEPICTPKYAFKETGFTTAVAAAAARRKKKKKKLKGRETERERERGKGRDR